ncbi:MAG: glycosyltransferase [Oleiphilaceae bacterium]|nr:glycosyltransferase [Oleiphilaceae bacterium]
MPTIDEQPLVSVVVASYNMAPYICQTIHSLINSSYHNIEIVVVDDGSTDDTRQKLAGFLDDQRVTYIFQENSGQTRAKNRGIEVSKGAFIAFCDADDYWVEDKLERQLPLFDDQDVGVVYSEVSYINSEGVIYEKEAPYQRYSGNITNKLLVKNFVPFGTAIFRRECIETSGVFNESYKMGIDWDLWLRFSLDWKFSFLPSKTYIYREWEGQMSNNHRGRYESAFIILTNFETEYGDRLNPDDLRLAWSDNYISRGVMYAKKEGLWLGPIRDVLKGIAIRPLWPYGWKALLKILLRRL